MSMNTIDIEAINRRKTLSVARNSINNDLRQSRKRSDPRAEAYRDTRAKLDADEIAFLESQTNEDYLEGLLDE